MPQKQHFSNHLFYPWFLITICAALLFYKYVLNVFPGVMSQELMKQFDVTGLGLGNLAATFFYTYSFMQVFTGVLIDKYGVRFLTGFATLIAAFGAFLFAHSTSLLDATFARGLMGIGVSFATVTYLKMTSIWFQATQKAFVGGLLATAVMLGAVFGQAPLALLLERTNWRFVLYFCSFLGFSIAILFFLFAKDRPTSQKQETDVTQKSVSWKDVKNMLSQKQNWILTAYSGLAFAPLSVLGGLWGTPFLQESYGLSRTQSSGLMSLIFIGLGLGSPLFGLLSDKLNKRLPMMKGGVLLSLAALLFVCYGPLISPWFVGICLFLFGFGVGAFMLGFTLGAQINRVALAATVVSLINTGDSLLESCTEPLIGNMLDFFWNGQMVNGIHYFSLANYRLAFIPLPVYLLVAFVLLQFVQEK